MFSSRTNWRLEHNRLAEALERHKRAGKPLLDLTNSNPTLCGFSYPQEEILAALGDPRSLEYHPESKGLLSARLAVANYYRGHSGFLLEADRGGMAKHASIPAQLDPERIVVTSGTSEGYSHIFRLLCEPGDDVLVPAPSYPLFEFLAELADVRLLAYPLVYDAAWQIDFGGLQAALTQRSRAVLVVHPNNPTGSFVRPREAAELTALCASRQMAIVADEVFLDFADSRPAATFACGTEALTFVLSGLSKTVLLPQMKLAWIAISGPEALASPATARLEIIADTYLSPSTPIQLALPKYLDLRESLQAQLRERVAANLACLDQQLGKARSLTRLQRDGGWYAVLRVPVAGPDDAMAAALLERFSVFAHPGRFFGFPSDGFLVLSLITSQDEFREGVARIVEFFRM